MWQQRLLFSTKINLCYSGGAKLLKAKQINSNLFFIGRHLCNKTNLQSKHDGVDKDKADILIYQGPLASKIRLAKLFSLSSSMIGLALQPVLYNKAVESGTGLGFTIAGAMFLGFFTFVTPVLLHLVSRKYVTHLFYNPYTEEFTASTFNIFLFPVLTIFKAEDVTRPELPTMFASFYVRNKPLFVDAEYFTNIQLYKKMMGFDKPIDFKISKPSNVP